MPVAACCKQRSDELLQADGITAVDFAALYYRGIDPNVRLIMLSCGAEDADVLRKITLRQSRHHAAWARTSDAQANGISDREHFSDPSILYEVFLAVFGPHHNVGSESVRLETPLRIRISEPVKTRRGQHMDNGGVEECPFGQRKVRDSVSMLQAFDICPILLGLGDRPVGA